MKRLIASLAVIAFLIAAPGLAPAQCVPSCGIPADAWLGNLSLSAGWTTNAGMTDYSVTAAGAGIAVGQAKWDYAYSAFYLAGTLPVSMGDYGAALLSGSLALPSTSAGRENLYNNAGVRAAWRTWSADTYWATLEGIWAYPLSGTFTALAGFRYVCWQTSYKSPVNEFGALYANTDTGDVTLNGYVPFVGLLATYGGLNVGAVGIPTTIGDVTHNEVFNGGAPIVLKASGTFSGGYFLEMFADYAMPIPGNLGPGYEADLSLFGKCSMLAIDATPSLDWTIGGVTTSETMDFSLHRNLFVVGAKATLNFNIAGMLPF